MHANIFNPVKFFWARANDIFLGIETAYRPVFETALKREGQHQDGTVYHAIDYWNIRRVLRSLKPGQDDVFCDIGCGKGRVVCCAARWRMKRVVGIELNGALCNAAQQNASRLRLQKSPIEIRCEDAATADLSEVTIYFLFNPFGERTMRDLLRNIETSLVINPRSIRIVYCNPVLTDILDSCDWLVYAGEFTNVTGGKIKFWNSPSRPDALP